MSGSKWISGLAADSSVADAARQVLSLRLQVVADYLPRALLESDKDPENVHQLRVGTRRARAALDLFSICLPEKTHKRLKKKLRAIRRAAGEARDWDVFIGALANPDYVPGQRHRAGLDYLMGHAMLGRAQAQDHLQMTSKNGAASCDQLVAEASANVEAPPGSGPQTVGELARLRLGDLLEELNQAGAAGFEDYARLHQVRILGKRLRYAMEVFAECFPAVFRDQLYPEVEEMQEILGRANDSHVALGRLQAVRLQLQAMLPEPWKRFRPGIEGLLRFHEERLPRERERFLEWWKEWRGSLAPAFLDLLRPLPGSEVAPKAS